MSEYTGYHLFNRSATFDDWGPGTNIARCRSNKRHTAGNANESQRIPVLGCGCGFWSFREFEGMLDDLPGASEVVSGSRGMWGFSPTDIGTVKAIGRVRNFGRVIEGELGFRAEKSRVVEVYDESGTPTVADMAAYFGVPVKRYPWLTATGTLEVQDRPGLASRISLWTGAETLTFFEKPTSQAYGALLKASTESFFVTVAYRVHPIGESKVPSIIRVVTA
jgi:hypothetical protein